MFDYDAFVDESEQALCDLSALVRKEYKDLESGRGNQESVERFKDVLAIADALTDSIRNQASAVSLLREMRGCAVR